MQKLYRDVSFETSRLITRTYSTSFSIAVSYLEHDLQDAIYSIYGFVRLADEIADSFLEFDRKALLDRFERDFYEAYHGRISTNPVLNSFQETVRKYCIPEELVSAFLNSMKTDLVKSEYYTKKETDEYIYGSAEVVGLMCLRVFVNGNDVLYEELKEPAKKLGAAFQKVNFLRDMRNDMENLNRSYFHYASGKPYNEEVKKQILDDISDDFRQALPGIKKLPSGARKGVMIAYCYFTALLKKIERTPAGSQFIERIRISDSVKMLLLGKALFLSKFGLI
jgi:phytoene/squalene synthetase